MSTLPIYKLDSRGGRRALDQLIHRGDRVLDVKLLRKALRIVRDVRSGGDRALLDAVGRFDEVAVASAAELALPVAEAVPSRDSDELPGGFAEAFERALVAVERFHRPQVRRGYLLEEDGVELEEVVLLDPWGPGHTRSSSGGETRVIALEGELEAAREVVPQVRALLARVAAEKLRLNQTTAAISRRRSAATISTPLSTSAMQAMTPNSP